MLHEKILNFIQTVSIQPVSSNDVGFRNNNVIEITRDLDPDRKLANSGVVVVKIPQSEVLFKFDNDTGEMIYIVNYKD